MAAAVKTLISGSRNLHINITGVFAVADETDTVVIDKSLLVNSEGEEPSKIRIDEITYSMVNYNYILLEWDTATDEVIEYLAGEGIFDYVESGGKNPTAVDGTGDILLTSSGGAAGGSYSILLKATLK